MKTIIKNGYITCKIDIKVRSQDKKIRKLI